MKQILTTLIYSFFIKPRNTFVLFLFLFLAFPSILFAQRFWVGGTGNWSNTANWSNASGGAGGFSVPNVNEDVFFDANSGAATYTVTVDVNAVCENLDFTGTNAMNFSTSSAAINLEVSANLTFVANVTTTGFTGIMKFTSNSGVASPYNITSLGKTLGAVQFDAGLTGTAAWQLPVGSPLNVSTSLSFFAGTLTTNNLAISTGSFTANSGADLSRTLNLGSSAVTITDSGAGTVADFSGNTANFVLNSGTSLWTFTGTGDINLVTGSFTKTLPDFTFSATTGNIVSSTTAVAGQTITYKTILVSSSATGFSSSDVTPPSTKIYSSTVTFNNPITANFDGNSTFNGNVSFPSNSTISFNHNVTTIAAAAFSVANAAAATTLSFAGNNSFAGTLSLGNNTTTNFNGATTQAFTNTITVGTTSNVTFANTITSCSFGNDVTLGAGTTWRFSSNAATTTTMSAGRSFINNGTCSNRVTLRSTTNGVAARLNLGTAQTWAHVNVGDINASFGAAIDVTTTFIPNPNLLNTTNVTFTGSTVGRNLFWVGGTGNWSNEANWSLSSGGAGGECIPTVNDNVRFDANSGAATYTATVDANAFCKNLVFTGTNTMNFSTSSAAINLEVSANLTFVANVTTTGFTGIMKFTSNSGVASPYNITSLGKTLGAVQFDAGLTGTAAWQLPVGSPLNVSTSLSFFAGTLTTNNLAISAGSFTANSGADLSRTLNLGSSAVTITGSGAGTVADFSGNTANFVLNSGTSLWTFTGTGDINLVTGSFTKTLPDFTFSATTGNIVSSTTAVAGQTITYKTILVSSSATGFSSSDVTPPSTKIYSSTVTFNNPITANFDGNSTFNGNVSFPSNSTISFNHNVTTAAAAAFSVANAAAATTLTFAGNNSFAGTLSLGNNTTTNFNGATTQAFTNTITIGTTSNVTFGNAVTSCSFAQNVTIGAGSTWRFSSNAATTTTMSAGRSFINNGTCSNRVTLRSTTNGVAARLNLGTAQTWAHVNVGDINASFGAAIDVTTTFIPNPNLLNTTNVTFTGSTVGRNLFWVGGTGNWSNEANWSLSSGGAGGECIPTVNDNVRFDANSGAATYTATVDANAFCKNLVFTGTNTMNFSTSSAAINLEVSANLTFVANVTTTGFTGIMKFTSNSGVASPYNITSLGKTLGAVQFDAGLTGTAAWQLPVGSPLNVSTSLSFFAGTLTTNNLAISAGSFTANSGADLSRTLNLGSSAVTITGSGAGTVADFSGNTANFVLNSGTSLWTFTGTGDINLVTGSFTKTLPDFTFSATTGNIVSSTTAVAGQTITYKTILVSSSATGFSSSDVTPPSTKIYSSTVTFNNPITANFDGNSTFNGNVSFPSNSTISFNHNVTTAAAAAFSVANAAAATTLTFAGNNSFAGTLSLGNNTTTNFNGATTQAFTNTITVGTTSNVTFGNAVTSCSFAQNVTIGAGSTWRFSSNAATTTTMSAGRSFINNGTCSNRVTLRSTTNGVAARLNLGTAQTWAHVNVGDINASFGAAIDVTTTFIPNPNLLNTTNVTFTGSTVGT